jgi:DNA-binding CsgD family transcriptional regulator
MRHLIPIIAMLALAFLAVSAFDLMREPAPVPPVDLALDLIEKLLLLGAMAAVAWAVLKVRDLRDGQDALKSYLDRSMAQGEAWRSQRQTEIAAMGQAITDQFRLWGLSPAEADVAGLLLKGCAMKEIAIARDTTDATIRQQAQTVYQKSGLSGRAELSAYFLDSLFSAAEEQGRARLRVVEP